MSMYYKIFCGHIIRVLPHILYHVFSYVEWYPGEMFRMPSDWDCVFPSISSKPRSQTPPQKEKIGIASLMATPWARSHKDLSKSRWWLKNNLEKYDFVNGKDDIPYMKWNNSCDFPKYAPHFRPTLKPKLMLALAGDDPRVIVSLPWEI